jgi:hypothetical protein
MISNRRMSVWPAFDIWPSRAKATSEGFSRALEQHRIASKARCLDQTLNGGPDMSDAHRNVPPIEKMLDLAVATRGIPDEV